MIKFDGIYMLNLRAALQNAIIEFTNAERLGAITSTKQKRSFVSAA